MDRETLDKARRVNASIGRAIKIATTMPAAAWLALPRIARFTIAIGVLVTMVGLVAGLVAWQSIKRQELNQARFYWSQYMDASTGQTRCPHCYKPGHVGTKCNTCGTAITEVNRLDRMFLDERHPKRWALVEVIREARFGYPKPLDPEECAATILSVPFPKSLELLLNRQPP